MRTCGLAWRMRRVASSPPIPGMCRSISTRSGCSASARATAARPSAASPTTATSASPRSIAPIPRRKGSWSSAMS